ncbi:MAG: 1-acyl-sn-glycerol-3-phosphate acyltransferase [Firmicutes bacterium]|nr:1-acyl-sn-glycerol-3-phosphate acyltransferase [Bacillota bacterium]
MKQKNKYVYNSFWYKVGWSIVIQLFARPILFCVSKIWCGWKIVGRQNIRGLKKQGYVLATNHVHPMDSSMVMLSIAPRKSRMTTLAMNLELKKGIGLAMKYLGCVGIPMEPAELKDFFREIIAEAKSGRPVIYMPEGHLIKDCSELRQFYDGAFFVAKKAGVPVLPAAISFHLRKNGKLRYVLNVGEPIDTTELSTKEISAKAREIMLGFTSGNKQAVEARYGAGVYSGDPKAEELMRKMQEQGVGRGGVK